MNSVFENWLNDANLVWLPQRGVGYLNGVQSYIYDAEYWNKYVQYDRTPLSEALNKARVDLVSRFHTGPLIDIGIGCGSFMRAWGLNRSFGYDINPVAVDWLNSRGLFRDPLAWSASALTFWDSLEHIPDPSPILRNATRWVFVAMPIYQSMGAVLTSKHYRPGEHCWYFTMRGFVSWMKAHGFELREFNEDETKLGREEIMSFAFERV